MAYSAYILLPERSNPLDQVVSLLRSFFENSAHPANQQMEIRRDEETVASVHRPGFRLYIEYRFGEELAEASEFANVLLEEEAHLATSGARLQVSTSSDPDMKFFNDYVLVCEQIEKLGDVALIDAHAGTRM